MKHAPLTLSVLSTVALVGACASSSPAPEEKAFEPAPIDALGLPNEMHPSSDLVTGGQPSQESLAKAKAMGVKTVVNLRVPEEEDFMAEEQALVEGMGLRYVSIPVGGSKDFTLEKAKELAVALGGAEAKPALVHCRGGNRVGALTALMAFHLEGKDVDAAIAAGKAAGLTHSEEGIRKMLESAAAASAETTGEDAEAETAE